MTRVEGPPVDVEFVGSARLTFWERVEKLWARPWFSYLTIFLLQLRVMWNIWRYKDLVHGDTSQYFAFGWEWYKLHLVHLAMSPLYTIFYGSMMWFTSDAYTATILHRMIIVLAGTVMVLGVMRRLVPNWVAWLLAAWWAILPVNFDAMYEVHQFALLPILAAWLIALRPRPGTWTRAVVLGIFVAATFLVRNEMIVPTICFAIFCFFDERRRHKVLSLHWKDEAILAAYLVPLVILFPILRWTYRHSDQSLSDLRTEMHDKHTLNMAQAYAFGYKQRHPEWTKNPWIDSAEVCKEVFGDPQPSLFKMLLRNPKALGGHLLWNCRLFPDGVQVLLFNGTMGSLNPDYAPVNLRSPEAMWGSIAAGLTLVVGFGLWWWEREKWRGWFSDARVGWEAMLSVVALTPFIVLTQRPRPEYLFGLSLFLMAAVGTAAWIIVSRIPARTSLGGFMTAVMVLPLVFLRSNFQPYFPERTVMWSAYERLLPFEHIIENPKVVYLDGGFAMDIVNYIGKGNGKPLFYEDTFADWQNGETTAQFLDRKGVNLFYLDEKEFEVLEPKHPGFLNQFFTEGGPLGWRLVGHEELADSWWMLMQRTEEQNPQMLVMPKFDQFSGWEDGENLTPIEGPYRFANLQRVRWALYPNATIYIHAAEAGEYELSINAQSPTDQQVRTTLDGVPTLMHHFLELAPFERVTARFYLTAGVHEVKFEFGKFIQTDRDKRRLALLFEELKVAPAGASTEPSVTGENGAPAAINENVTPTTAPSDLPTTR